MKSNGCVRAAGTCTNSRSRSPFPRGTRRPPRHLYLAAWHVRPVVTNLRCRSLSRPFPALRSELPRRPSNPASLSTTITTLLSRAGTVPPGTHALIERMRRSVFVPSCGRGSFLSCWRCPAGLAPFAEKRSSGWLPLVTWLIVNRGVAPVRGCEAEFRRERTNFPTASWRF